MEGKTKRWEIGSVVYSGNVLISFLRSSEKIVGTRGLIWLHGWCMESSRDFLKIDAFGAKTTDFLYPRLLYLHCIPPTQTFPWTKNWVKGQHDGEFATLSTSHLWKFHFSFMKRIRVDHVFRRWFLLEFVANFLSSTDKRSSVGWTLSSEVRNRKRDTKAWRD